MRYSPMNRISAMAALLCAGATLPAPALAQYGWSDDEVTSSSGGGVFIAMGAIGGVFAGGFLGQPSAGLLIGLAVGSLAALAIWWTGR